jgi:hypothetical protein
MRDRTSRTASITTLVNAAGTGTKVAVHNQLSIGAGQTATLRLRLSPTDPDVMLDAFVGFEQTFEARQREAGISCWPREA